MKGKIGQCINTLTVRYGLFLLSLNGKEYIESNFKLSEREDIMLLSNSYQVPRLTRSSHAVIQ